MFTSWAQNFEDVILARCFRQPHGFYVDVGAHDPDIDSVTRAFYERGWSGINIEPLPGAAARLRARRPRDVNLEIACGAAEGTVTLYDVDQGGGVSTTVADLAAEFAAHGYPHVPRTVPVRRLADVLEEHAAGKDIDFLKIDVEGAESDVVAGADLARWRPAVLVIETRLPVRLEMIERVDEVPDRYAEMAAMLAPLRYTLVYRDGTNSFFVAEEHAPLVAHFRRPPGVFDRFVHAASVRQLEAELAEARAEIARLKAR